MSKVAQAKPQAPGMDVVAHTYNPSYLGSGDRRIVV
jgi:hypothetical protein